MPLQYDYVETIRAEFATKFVGWAPHLYNGMRLTLLIVCTTEDVQQAI